MNKQRFLSVIVVFVTKLFIGACSGPYAVTLNNQPVYTPKPLFSDYAIRDAALKACVQQTIADQKATEAGQLIKLDCSDAGVTMLEGIERFYALAKIDLSNNKITDASALAQLPSLTFLNLENNVLLVCDNLENIQINGTAKWPAQCFNEDV